MADLPEVVLVYKCGESKKGKAKKVICGDLPVECRAFTKAGDQSAKICKTLAALISSCGAAFTNLEVEEPGGPEASCASTGIGYRETLSEVIGWGLDHFEEFRGNAMLKATRPSHPPTSQPTNPTNPTHPTKPTQPS